MAARLWQKAPFVRLLVALIVGIVGQWHWQLPLLIIFIALGLFVSVVVIYSFLTISLRYRLAVVNGVAALLLFVMLGALLVWFQDVRNNKDWAGHRYRSGDYIIATLQEPLIEKANSYKADANFISIHRGDTTQLVSGKLIFYFKKDPAMPALGYGSRILFFKNLQRIQNSGNPGGFDYNRYSLFHGITHQAYLTANDYVVLPEKDQKLVDSTIYAIRDWVVKTLRRYIPGEKEAGLAEALLIGYKDDLDKKLVEAYSNTGVVHIIAISGLHLGIIYWLLLAVTKPLKRIKRLAWLRLVITIVALWAFTLLAGAQPSVLRSAVMFTVIALGQLGNRRSSIYNTMALSAFVLLCINPFWLWDVGFQLSYTAVLSIIIFFQPVYNWFYLPNKGIDFFWKLTAVTIAAQVLTLPISIYHFHQAPLLFLFTNFIAVPLSSLVLIGEILLCALSSLPVIAKAIGWLLYRAIVLMNFWIEGFNAVPFAVWGGLSINMPQMLLMIIVVVAACWWLMERDKRLAWTAGLALAAFIVIRGLAFTEACTQQKLIVYNVPKHPAIDVINGRGYRFIGDTTLLYNDFLRNFHLQPSRIKHRITLTPGNYASLKSFLWEGKQVMIIDDNYTWQPAAVKQTVDLLVLSKNPRLYISNLTGAFLIKQAVIDGSVPKWKAALWQRDCDSLRIPCHNVTTDGAFVLTVR